MFAYSLNAIGSIVSSLTKNKTEFKVPLSHLFFCFFFFFLEKYLYTCIYNTYIYNTYVYKTYIYKTYIYNAYTLDTDVILTRLHGKKAVDN